MTEKISGKIYLLIIFLFCSIIPVKAQILDPVKWTFEVENLGNGECNLIFKADIEKHWHLYTQNVPESDNSPLPTEFFFEKQASLIYVDGVQESKSVTAFEKVLGVELSFFENKATFKQKVRNLSENAVKIIGSVTYMACDDKMCLPPETVENEFTIPAEPRKEKKSNIETGAVNVNDSKIDLTAISIEEDPEILDPVKWSFKVERIEDNKYRLIASAQIDKNWHVYARKLESDEGPVPTTLKIEDNKDIELLGEIRDVGEMHTEYDPNFMMNLSYYDTEVQFIQEFKLNKPEVVIRGFLEFMCCDNEKCLPPEEVPFELIASDKDKIIVEKVEKSTVTGSLSFWATFLKGFFGGFIALLTPCVFPMIPLTVSFFTKQSKTRAKGISNAILYSASIIGIYVLLGYGVTAIFGADALNALSTNVWFNLGFFVLLVVFAISFFGAFEITLPSSWVNKADSASDKGGILGIFFMAFTLSLVSFSCTGPIIGTLLVDAAVNGGVMGPLVGMFGFSLALALPFGLFAAFPGWLNSLPSSGGWLNSVKVVLGFLELAFAFKFLSNADLVMQAGLLKRELFIAIWIAIFALLTAYLLGLFSLPHDSKSDKISVPRLMMAIVTLMFTVYLIPGIWGAPLKIISGFPPPMFYSESPQGLGSSTVVASPSDKEGEIVGDPDHCPHQLNCFHDYDEGLEYARKVNKPVMLDFTGWACVNCRKMEEQVWSDPRVLSLLKNEFVLISLYVDEKLELPESEQKEVQIGKKTKKIKTVGNKWSYFQAVKYNTNSQPYYVILDHNENTLNGSAAYDPDIVKFENWLKEGLEIFKKPNITSVN